jgi:hypothetical protein
MMRRDRDAQPEAVGRYHESGEKPMSDTVMAVQARFPERLLDEANALVRQGWFEDLDSVLQEALRRYLDAHRSELLDRFVREDVAWGLGGKD